MGDEGKLSWINKREVEIDSKLEALYSQRRSLREEMGLVLNKLEGSDIPDEQRGGWEALRDFIRARLDKTECEVITCETELDALCNFSIKLQSGKNAGKKQ